MSSFRQRWQGIYGFSAKCFRLMATEGRLFAAFLVLSVLAALTEGLGISLLVPLLDATREQSSFQDLPLLRHVAAFFREFDGQQRILVMAGALAVVILFRGLLQLSVDALGTYLPLKLAHRFTLQGYTALLSTNLGYINNKDIGYLNAGINGHASRVANLLKDFAGILWNSLVLIVLLAIMIGMSPLMTVCATAFAITISVLFKLFANGPISRAGRRLSDATMTANRIIHETLGGMKLIRLATAEHLMIRRFNDTMATTLHAQRTATILANASNPFLTTGSGLFICLLLVLNGMQNSGDQAALAPLLLFLFLLMRMLGPVTAINMARHRIAADLPAFELLEKFLSETRQAQQRSGSTPFDALRDRVEFRNVSFTYDNADRDSLSDINLTIRKGSVIALVGPSGAGKSTIASLLAGFHEPTRGAVCADGIDLRELDITQWRRHIAMVSQDTFIFDDSVLNNITFGQAGVSMDQARAAVRQAAADDFIERLPQGYDTMLGNRGVRLSGGQQQRIAIARAIIANADIMIFDEATSHLDSITETAIQKAIDTLAEERTLIIIAHRLSTIRKADTVVVLKDGRIIENGPHHELMARQGAYWEMLRHQQLDLVDESDIPATTPVAGDHEH